MITAMKLSPDQIAALDKIATNLLMFEPGDRVAAIVVILDNYSKSLHAKHPDLSEEKIKATVDRFSTLIIERYNALAKSSVDGGHA